MCCCDQKSVLEVVQIVLTCIGILGAGLWALFVFIRQRENKPRVEFSADIIFHKKVGDWWIVELLAVVENKGKIQQKLYNLDIDFSSIGVNDRIELAERFNNQVHFPNSIVNGSFLNPKTVYFFIEPGVKSKYSHITRVPANALTVNLHTKFKYKKHGWFCRKVFKLNRSRSHTAEATKAVPVN